MRFSNILIYLSFTNYIKSFLEYRRDFRGIKDVTLYFRLLISISSICIAASGILVPGPKMATAPVL